MSDMPENDEIFREEISSLLRFYAESGLDFPVSDVATNQFEATLEKVEAAPAANVAQPNTQTFSQSPHDPHAPAMIDMDPRKRQADAPRPLAQPSAHVTIPTEEVVAKAIAMADAAQNLDDLKTAVETFEGCNLKRSARSTVFEGGKRGAKLMFIGGAPSRDDDISGDVFSGADGILLDKMLAAIGLSRQTDAYLGFCVPWSPPGGSAPTPLHLEICAPFIARQIQLAQPDMVIALGNTAARQILQTKQTIVQVRGKWTTLPNFNVQAMAMCDPNMLRNQPAMKRHAWMDLLSIKSKLNG